MTNPAVISTPVNVWTKVATGVTSGMVTTLTPGPYLQTFRDTTDPAPTTKVDAVPLTSPFLLINNSVAIDIYIMAIRDVGSVRVDL
jgi:hypothetical protein